MPRPKVPVAGDLAERLLIVKMKVRALKNAMPNAAREMRREACEELDDIIVELRAG